MDIEKYFSKLYSLKNDNSYSFENKIITLAEKTGIPYLHPIKANILEVIVKIKKPLSVFEIGLGSGFSTYKILKSLPKNGKLISTDSNIHRVQYFYENIFPLLSKNFKKNLEVYWLDAFYLINIFTNINKKFDLIFLDAIKRDYIKYLEKLPCILNKKGILIIDNVTYKKQTFNKNPTRSEEYQKGIKLVDNFNKKLITNKNFITCFIPAGDGLSISILKD